jgi:hypothetical protein
MHSSQELATLREQAVRRYRAAERPAREAARAAISVAAAAQFGELTDREIIVAGAIAYWRHNPETTRKNTSDGYYGCLRVDVKRSCVLYRKTEGWASAAMRVAAAPD